MLGELHEAVLAGDLTGVKKILDSSSDKYGFLINGQNETEQTALHLAADNSAMTQLLLSRAADVTIEDAHGHTALTDAVIYKNSEVVNLLLNAGANPLGGMGARDHTLNIATDLNWIEGIEALLDHGADINAPGLLGLTALHTAIFRRDNAAFDLLLARGADSHILLSNNETALHEAVRYDNLHAFSALVKTGIDQSIRNNEGQTVYDLLRLRAKSHPRENLEPFLATQAYARREPALTFRTILQKCLWGESAGEVAKTERSEASRSSASGHPSSEF